MTAKSDHPLNLIIPDQIGKILLANDGIPIKPKKNIAINLYMVSVKILSRKEKI